MSVRELQELVGEGFKVLFVLGKGGVGKTTVSILLSRILSEAGKVLLASLDPAMHLLEYLKLDTPGKRVRVRERLYAIQYDVNTYSKRVLDEFAVTLKRLMPGLTVLNMDRVVNVIRDAPGFEEEVFLRMVSELYNATDYNYVVIDTPPTGIALRVLMLPRLYVTWVKGLKELRENILSIKYAIARALGERIEPRDPVLDKLRELEERYSRLLERLRGKETIYVAVATPEPLPVYEVKVIASKLTQLGSKPHLIVVNRVLGEIASRLGVEEIEVKALKEVEEIRCKYGAAGLLIKHAGFAPRSLEDVERIMEKGIVFRKGC